MVALAEEPEQPVTVCVQPHYLLHLQEPKFKLHLNKHLSLSTLFKHHIPWCTREANYVIM